MDPVSALAFSCNVLDILERAYKGCRKFRELYDSPDGRTAWHQGIDDDVSGMRTVVDDLTNTRSSVPMSREENGSVDQSLLLVASRCGDLAKDLAKAVDKCRVKKPGSVFSSGKATLRSVLKKSDMKDMQNDLQHWSQTLITLLTTCTHREVCFMLKQLRDAEMQRGGIITKLERMEFSIIGKMDSMMGKGNWTEVVRTAMNEVREKVNGVNDIAEEAQCELNRQLILRNLKFLGTDLRAGEIHEAASNTFGWILEDAAELSLRRFDDVGFAKWLETGSGIFHVTGKPGSGKSTLMKYITDHSRTRDLLTQWAGPRRSVMAKFFLWKPGNSGQKSFKGLIHGLLYDATKAVPELTQFLFPQFWDPVSVMFQSAHVRSQFDITEKDIKAAFERLVGISPEITDAFQICFFIDGLDEFDDHLGVTMVELCRNIKDWSANCHDRVKICISSREWPVFESLATSTRYKMSLHNLTQGDIAQLVSSTLNSHEVFSELRNADPLGCRALIDQIVQHAEGVFLWVTLMLRSLGDGLSNRDSLVMLQNRVSSTPSELNEFFKIILDSIDTQYRQSAYYLFAIVMRSAGTLLCETGQQRELADSNLIDSSVFANADTEWVPYVSLLSCSFLFEAVDSKLPLDHTNCPDRIRSDEQVMARVHTASIQVRGRCKSLLDVGKTKTGGEFVSFIHRSIPDYLQVYLSERVSEFDLTNEMVGQILVWTVYAQVQSLDPLGLIMDNHSWAVSDTESFLENPRSTSSVDSDGRHKEFSLIVNTSYSTADDEPSTYFDSNSDTGNCSSCCSIDVDGAPAEEIDWVQDFVTDMETTLHSGSRQLDVVMFNGRMYHILDWGESHSNDDPDREIKQAEIHGFSPQISEAPSLAICDDDIYAKPWYMASSEGSWESEQYLYDFDEAPSDTAARIMRWMHHLELAGTPGMAVTWSPLRPLREYPSNSMVPEYHRGRMENLGRDAVVNPWIPQSVIRQYSADRTNLMSQCGYLISRLRQIESVGQRETFLLLDHLDCTICSSQWAHSREEPPDFLWATVREPRYQEAWRRGAHFTISSPRSTFSMIGIACFFGLYEYVAWRLDAMDSLNGNGFFASYLLTNALDGLVCRPSACGKRVLDVLFEHNISVNVDVCPLWYQNDGDDGGLVWFNYLFEVFCELHGPAGLLSEDSLSTDVLQQHWPTVQLCLERGADPEFAVMVKASRRSGGGRAKEAVPTGDLPSGCFACMHCDDVDDHFINDILRQRAQDRRLLKHEAIMSEARKAGRDCNSSPHTMAAHEKKLRDSIVSDETSVDDPTFRPLSSDARFHFPDCQEEQEEDPRVTLDDLVETLKPPNQDVILQLLHRNRQLRRKAETPRLFSLVRSYLIGFGYAINSARTQPRMTASHILELCTNLLSSVSYHMYIEMALVSTLLGVVGRTKLLKAPPSA